MEWETAKVSLVESQQGLLGSGRPRLQRRYRVRSQPGRAEQQGTGQEVESGVQEGKECSMSHEFLRGRCTNRQWVGDEGALSRPTVAALYACLPFA